MRRSIISAAILVLLCFFSVNQASAGIGLRVGRYTDNKDFFLGADYKASFALLSVNPNVEYVFVDNARLGTANLDGAFNLTLFPTLSTWIGGGLGIMYSDPDGADSTTDGVVNLIAGIGLGVPLQPYLQFKYILADSDQFVVGVGIRF